MLFPLFFSFFFFFNDTATTEIYTLSLHDALPIFRIVELEQMTGGIRAAICPTSRALPFDLAAQPGARHAPGADRKSTRLNSSHITISYAVFCLKKKNNQTNETNLIFPKREDLTHH